MKTRSNEMNNPSKHLKVMAIIAINGLALAALSLTACPPPEPEPTHTHEWEWKVTTPATPTADGLETETCKTCGAESGNTRIIAKLPNPNETTITAFGKEATVIGDASISTADFNTAKGKLESTFIEEVGEYFNSLSPSEKGQLTNIMDRGITIVIGNTAPACVNGALTVGVDYLKSNGTTKIIDDIFVLIDANAFADPYTPLYTNPKTITQETPNGLAFEGKVTIRTDDQYTAAEWDAVVAKVVAALNRGYDKFTTVGGFDDDYNKDNFEMAFDVSKSAEIIISASASKKIEVLSTDYTKMYLKSSAINDTFDLQPAVNAMAMTDGGYELANATPAKDRVFLT
jgi:hypothetical protein